MIRLTSSLWGKLAFQILEEMLDMRKFLLVEVRVLRSLDTPHSPSTLLPTITFQIIACFSYHGTKAGYAAEKNIGKDERAKRAKRSQENAVRSPSHGELLAIRIKTLITPFTISNERWSQS